MENQEVVVIAPESDDKTIVNPAHGESIVMEYRKYLVMAGIYPESLDAVCEIFRVKIMTGADPLHSKKEMHTVEKEFLGEQRDAVWESHAMSIAKQFKLTIQQGEQLARESRKQFHPDSTPEYKKALVPIFEHAKELSHQAYLARSAKRSVLVARVDSGNVK